MIQRPETYVQEEGIHNVQFIQRDIVDQGTGLKQGHEGKHISYERWRRNREYSSRKI